MTKNASGKRKSQQWQAITRMLILAAILVCINLLAARFHYGLDLTFEKRFTLSNSTKKLLRNMDDVAVINVYLKGKFPASFQRLSDATRERLESFRVIAGSKIVYKFINPFEGKLEEEKGPIYEEFASKGMFPMNLPPISDEEGYSDKLVFPYALVQYKGKQMPVNLYENNRGVNELINQAASETLLEYKLANAINILGKPDRVDIAYIIGHGESLGINTYDLLMTLGSIYHLDTIDLASTTEIPKNYKAIIINKPTIPIDDREKFKIDQYIMNGGNVLWTIDQLFTPMDSLSRPGNQQFMTLDYGLELDDMLFKYGVRVNLDIIEDQQSCLPLPLFVMTEGQKRQMQLRPWMYYPLFVPTSKHPIVKNLPGIMARFANSIDTLNTPDVKKTVLLESSKYSRTEAFPVRVSLSMLRYPLTADMFNNPYRPAAVLLEGKFHSVFDGRMAPNFLKVLRDSLHREFLTVSDTGRKMIVIGDGEIFENDFSQSQQMPTEMGYWTFIKTRFYNKDFMLNCVEYLTDNSGLIEARAKDEVIRKLDGKRITKEKLTWQIVNIGIPIFAVLIFASAYIFFRKRRYEKTL